MAANMEQKISWFERLCQEYDFIRFTWADLHGISRGKTLASRNILNNVHGITAYSGGLVFGPRSELPNITKITEDARHSNMMVTPDYDTLHHLPWAGQGKDKVGAVLCETRWIHDDSPQIACPRYIAKTQLERLWHMGYDLLSGFELEFVLMDQATSQPVFAGNDEMCTTLLAEYEPFLFEVDDYMLKAGVNILTIQTEYSPGQFELTYQPERGIRGADTAFILKHGLKEMALAHGLQASFMAKMDVETVGNGAHFNHSLWDKNSGLNAFYDPKGKNNLSKIAEYWIGGLLKHSSALAALCSPTVNCYRRLHIPWSPDYIDWGIESRWSSFRVINTDEKKTYIENRVPSGCANPYLVLAGTVAAGIDGIVNRIECPPQVQKDRRLPNDLEEALQALESDSVIVEALGREFVDWFATIKRQIEIESLKSSDIKAPTAEALAEEFKMYAPFV